MPDYLTSGVFWNTVITSLSVTTAATVILTWLGKNWLVARIQQDVEDVYTKKRQERQADHDRSLESHKHELSQRLEGWKSAYQKTLSDNQIRFSRFHQDQADAIRTLYVSLVNTEQSLNDLVSPFKFTPKNDDHKTSQTTYLHSNYNASFYKCRSAFWENRILFSPKICEQTEIFLALAQVAYLDYTTYDGQNAGMDAATLSDKRKLQKDAYELCKKQLPELREILEEEFRQAMGVPTDESDSKKNHPAFW